ncbi:MAG: hypothetical protein ACK5KR_02615 [Breznakia sp.]
MKNKDRGVLQIVLFIFLSFSMLVSCAANKEEESKTDLSVCLKQIEDTHNLKIMSEIKLKAKNDELMFFQQVTSAKFKKELLQAYIKQGYQKELEKSARIKSKEDKDDWKYFYRIDEEKSTVKEYSEKIFPKEKQRKEEYDSLKKTIKHLKKEGYSCKKK